MVEFFLLCRTCEHDLKDFDPYLNMKQLAETLSLVMSLYEDLDSGNTVTELSRTDLEDYIYDDHSEDSEDDSDSDSKGDEGAETKIVQDSKASEKDASAKKGFSEEDADDGDTRENVRSSESGTAASDNVQENESASPPGRRDKRQNVIISCCNLREEAAALYLLVNLGNEEAIMNVLKLPQIVK